MKEKAEVVFVSGKFRVIHAGHMRLFRTAIDFGQKLVVALDISELSEEEVLGMLNNERQTLKRVSVLERMHQRYNTLRVARERLELLKEAKLP